jgi:hypothetical protein
MKHRPAVTLLEVLVTIFVMGIGLLALLVLFPLGAFNIAEALKDDRAANAGKNAEAMAIVKDIRHDPLVIGAFTTPFPRPPYADDPRKIVYSAFDLPPTWSGPSSPVFVDPYYVVLGSADIGNFTPPANPGIPTPGIPRRGLNWVKTNAQLTRWFTLLDDITFSAAGNGKPEGPDTGGAVQRAGRYTWAYMLKRPRTSNEMAVDLSVVVYGGRSVQLQAGENSYDAAGIDGDNTLTLSWPTGQTAPALRKGVWLLDTSVDLVPDPVAVPPVNRQVVRGNFYRVVNTSDVTSANGLNSVSVEIQGKIRTYQPSPGGQQFNGTVVVMEQVVEVFERGDSWQP